MTFNIPQMYAPNYSKSAVYALSAKQKTVSKLDSKPTSVMLKFQKMAFQRATRYFDRVALAQKVYT